MLSQQEIECLLQILKELMEKQPLAFPSASDSQEYQIVSEDKRDKFIINANRKGHINITKCTFQERHQSGEILLRLDLNGRPHTNPDGEVLPCPHLHIIKENCGTSWAYPVPKVIFTDINDLLLSFINFLEYCKVKGTESIIFQDGLGFYCTLILLSHT